MYPNIRLPCIPCIPVVSLAELRVLFSVFSSLLGTAIRSYGNQAFHFVFRLLYNFTVGYGFFAPLFVFHISEYTQFCTIASLLLSAVAFERCRRNRAEKEVEILGFVWM